jgi:hypothetical protein
MIAAPQSWSFLRIFSLFAANQWNCLSRNHLHATLGFRGQAQSRLIKIFHALIGKRKLGARLAETSRAW